MATLVLKQSEMRGKLTVFSLLQVWFQNARAKWRRMMLKQEGKSGEKCSNSDNMSDMDMYPHGPSSMGSNISMNPHSPPFIMPPGSPSSVDCSWEKNMRYYDQETAESYKYLFTWWLRCDLKLWYEPFKELQLIIFSVWIVQMNWNISKIFLDFYANVVLYLYFKLYFWFQRSK